MAHRTFTDSTGRAWDVWTVVPSRVERRRQDGGPPAGDTERRHHDESRVLLAEEWAEGWLTFETKGEKRRLAPFPDAWPELSPLELEMLCQGATLVPPSRRTV